MTRKTITRRLMLVLMSMILVICSMPLTGAYADTGEAGQAGAQAGAQADLRAGADAQAILDSMTLRQKITQCFMMDFMKWTDEKGTYDMTVLSDEVADIIADYQFGSVIYFANNIKNTKETLQLTKDMQKASMRNGGIPLMIATDQEGGIVYRLGSGTALPGNMAIGAAGDVRNAEISGQIIGSELDSVGINTTLAPVLDVNNNANNTVIGIRSFGDDPETVGAFGTEYIKGLNQYNIIGCAKHYPGHGDTGTDSHTGLPIIEKTKEELEATEFVPFKVAISQGIDMIMTAHILYPKVDDSTVLSDKTGKEEARTATISEKFLKGILRDELKFEGVVITDGMNMKGMSDRFSEEQGALEAIKAGADMVCMPVTGIYNNAELRRHLDSVINYIEEAVNRNYLSRERLDEAVLRILTLNQKKGILEYDESRYTEERALATVGSAKNRKQERAITEKSVTLIRNNNNALPYKAKSRARILMLCPYNNERAQMIMGFNRAKKAGKVPFNAKVWVYRYSSADDQEQLSGKLKENVDWADLVVINSELYGVSAMGYGRWDSKIPLLVTDYCKANGKKSVIISINTPYDTQLYPNADAVCAVYGWKGSSIDPIDAIIKEITDSELACGPNIIAGVEAVFGMFDPQGKLPVNIPEFDSEKKCFTDKILYPRGYGLSYPKVIPGKAKIKTLKAGKRKFTLTAARPVKAIKGTKYQTAYKVKGTSKWKYKKSTEKTVTVSKLKKGRRYVVKLRAINTSGVVTTYGKWSVSKTVKVK